MELNKRGWQCYCGDGIDDVRFTAGWGQTGAEADAINLVATGEGIPMIICYIA